MKIPLNFNTLIWIISHWWRHQNNIYGFCLMLLSLTLNRFFAQWAVSRKHLAYCIKTVETIQIRWKRWFQKIKARVKFDLIYRSYFWFQTNAEANMKVLTIILLSLALFVCKLSKLLLFCGLLPLAAFKKDICPYEILDVLVSL